MFDKLFDFKYKRKSIDQIVGFYLFHLLFLILLAVTAYSAVNLLINQNSIVIGTETGKIIRIFYSLTLSFLVLYKKKLYKKPVPLLITLASPVLAFYGAGVLGLIPAAYLSSK